jgi:hypothetical protein
VPTYNPITNEWDSCDGGAGETVYIYANLDPTLEYTHFLYNTNPDTGVPGDEIRVWSGPIGALGTLLVDTSTKTWIGSVTGARTILVSPGNGGGSTPFGISEIAIGGTGPNPYGESNCLF